MMVAGTGTASAAYTNTFTWTGGTNTNAASASGNYTVTGTGATTNTGTGYNYTNSTYPTVYDFNNTAIYAYGLTNSGSTNDVIFTNVTAYRLDQGGVLLTNNSGKVGKVAGNTLYIYNTLESQLGGNVTFSGNMALYYAFLGGHSSSARTVTQNLASMCISNFGVNYSGTTNLTAPTMTWGGSGTTTITGVITNKAWLVNNGLTTNNGYLAVTGGVMNIATTNALNATANLGWNSGLIISNTASVYVGGQNSLGAQAFDIKMGSAAAQASTFGLFGSNEWATNAANSAIITNNFVINNGGATATNRFLAGSNSSLTMSGKISSANTNGTFQVGAGTLTLSGTNSGLLQNISVLTNATLVAASSTALGTGSVTITNGAKLQVAADLGVTSKVTNQSGGTVSITDGGRISSSALGAGALTLGGSLGNAATFNDTLGSGTQTIGALSITNYGTISMNFGSVLQSSGAVTIAGVGNLLSMSGTALTGTNNLIIGTSLVLTSSDISITGFSGSNTLSLGSSFSSGVNNYTFTNTGTTLQLLVTSSAQNLYWNGAANNSWSINPADLNWQNNGTGANVAFASQNNALFSNSANVTVDAGGVTAGSLTFTNASGTQVILGGGTISATSLSASGAGTVTVNSGLTVAGSAVVSGGSSVTTTNLTISGGLTVTNATLTTTGDTAITGAVVVQTNGRLSVTNLNDTGALTVGGGTATLNGSSTITSGVTVSSGSLIENGGATIGGGMTLNGGQTTLNGSTTVTAGGITLNNTGTQLTNNGTTTINAGGFAMTGAQTVTDNGNLNVSAGGFSMNGGAVLGTGTITANAYTITFSTNIAASLAGTGSLTVNGNTTIRGTNNSYSGGTILNAGLLSLSNGAVLGSTNGMVSINGGGLDMGGTTITNSTFTAGTNATVATLTNGNIVVGNAYLSNSIQGNGTLTANTFTLGTGSISLSNSLAGSASLTKAGSGTVYLYNSNSYTGGSSFTGGSVQIANSSSFGTGDVYISTPTSFTLRALNNKLNIQNNIQIGGGTLAIGPTNTGGWELTNSGVISGVGALGNGVNSGGNLYLANTNNSFAGGVFATNGGTIYGSYIGNAGSNSSFGTSGTISIGNSTTAGSIRSYNSNNETTDKTFSINVGTGLIGSIYNYGSTTNNGALTNSPNGATTLTLTADLAVGGSANNKIIGLGAYNSNTLAINGQINDNGGYTTQVNVGTSSTGTVLLNYAYNGFTGGLFITNSTSGQTTTLSVSDFGNNGAAYSQLGGGSVTLTGTAGTANLRYTGTGGSSDRIITLTGVNNTLSLDASGTGDLVLTSALNMGNNASHYLTLTGTTNTGGELTGAITNVVTTAGTINKSSVAAASTTISLSSVVGLQVGQIITGTGIAANTTITAISPSTSADGSGTITLSTATTNVSSTATGTGAFAFVNTADSSAVTVTNQTALTKNGTNTWTLSGVNTYSGNTKISAGTLRVTNAAALSSASTLNSGGSTSDSSTLEFMTAGDYTMNALSLGGTMNFTNSSAGSATITFTNTSTNSGITGTATKSMQVQSNTTVNIAGPFELGLTATQARSFTLFGNGGTVNFNGAITNTINAVNTFTNGITLAANSTVTVNLNASNSYNGNTVVNGGTLNLNNSNAIGTGSLVVGGGTANLGTYTVTNALGDVSGGLITNGTISNNGGIFNITNMVNSLVTTNFTTNGSVVTTNTSTNYTTNAATIAATLAGSDSLAMNGAGTLNLTGVNTYTGGSAVNTGTVMVYNTSSLGTGTVTMNGGTLDLGQVTLANSFSLSGGTVTNGSLVNTQLTSVQGGTVGAVITGTGGLTKSGTQTLTLTAANTYMGDTVVSAGTLLVNGSIDSNQNVNVSTNATLGGSGSVGNVTVNSGGTLAPSANGSTSYATLTVASLTTTNGSTTKLAIGSSVPGNFDSIYSLGDIVLKGNLQFTFNSQTLVEDSYYLFQSGGAITGDLSSVTQTGLAGETSFVQTANEWSAIVNADQYYKLTFDQTTGVLSVLVVPEPSTYAMVGFGVVALLSARYLRRRKIGS